MKYAVVQTRESLAEDISSLQKSLPYQEADIDSRNAMVEWILVNKRVGTVVNIIIAEPSFIAGMKAACIYLDGENYNALEDRVHIGDSYSADEGFARQSVDEATLST